MMEGEQGEGVLHTATKTKVLPTIVNTDRGEIYSTVKTDDKLGDVVRLKYRKAKAGDIVL